MNKKLKSVLFATLATISLGATQVTKPINNKALFSAALVTFASYKMNQWVFKEIGDNYPEEANQERVISGLMAVLYGTAAYLFINANK